MCIRDRTSTEQTLWQEAQLSITGVILKLVNKGLNNKALIKKQKRVVELKRMLTSLIENLVLTEMVMGKTLLTIRGALPKEEPKVHLPTVKAD